MTVTFQPRQHRAHHDDVRFGGFDRLLDLRPQRIAAPQLARIDPHVLLELSERLLESAYDRVVVHAVGDEQLGHVYASGVLDRHPTEGLRRRGDRRGECFGEPRLARRRS